MGGGGVKAVRWHGRGKEKMDDGGGD
jgi:hypothetical protein